MKNKRIEGRTVLALLLVTTLSLTACKKKDVFQQELYNELLTEACPVDPIDASHRWTTTTRRMVTVYVNAGMGDLLKLQLLNDNPAVNSRAEIMAEQDAPQEGSYYTLVFAAPAAQTNFYAALTTADGRYAVVPFTADDRQVDFSQKTELNNIGTPGYQTFTYCFEESFPRPDDFDFNDCILRIALLPGESERQLRLNVDIAAVSSQQPIAAAIRLVNIDADEIESVNIAEGKPFDDGYPLPLSVLKDKETLLHGQKGEAVIRLCEDAMWSMLRNAPDASARLARYYVNVTRTADELHKQMTPVSRQYVINFKETAKSLPLLSSFTLDNIDPFIITSFNGAYWETHAYAYQNVCTLFSYADQTDLNMTWALVIPNHTTFRWPLEGHLIGTYKEGILTGAYRQPGHAFGEWAANSQQANDWYLYPTATEVY